ncbi:hypothetical protein BSKO_06359 [Bryopsis sp. KO-2023]|nr:hypothetical protein BSKO_06359 [Bryopsis sp. KO-2023]
MPRASRKGAGEDPVKPQKKIEKKKLTPKEKREEKEREKRRQWGLEEEPKKILKRQIPGNPEKVWFAYYGGDRKIAMIKVDSGLIERGEEGFDECVEGYMKDIDADRETHRREKVSMAQIYLQKAEKKKQMKKEQLKERKRRALLGDEETC